MLSLFNPFKARWPANSKLRLYVVVTPVSVASWPETISGVRISVQGRSLWCCGVTKTEPIIGNFLTFWWFWLLVTDNSWLQTGKLFSILKILFCILIIIFFPKKHQCCGAWPKLTISCWAWLLHGLGPAKYEAYLNMMNHDALDSSQ